MKSWHKKVLTFGLPLLSDWIKSFWGSSEPSETQEVKELEVVAKRLLKQQKFEEYQQLKGIIRGLKDV